MLEHGPAPAGAAERVPAGRSAGVVPQGLSRMGLTPPDGRT